MEKNIKLSHMSHWKTIPYKQIDNFREFYYEDRSNNCYYMDWDRILRYHKATGYDGIEVAPWDLGEILGLFGTAQEYTAFAKDHGIEVSGMFHGCDDSHIASKHEEVVAAGKAAVDTLKSFGGTHLNTCPGNNFYGNGPLDEEGLRNIASCLNEIGEYAEASGIKIGIHNEFFCITNKLNHRKLIELTDPRYVHYCLDTAQVVLMGDDLIDFYDTYKERICTFHCKDTADLGVADEIRYAQDVEICDDGHRWFWEPGEGKLPMKELWKHMADHGFKGWVTVEDDGAPDYLAAMALSSYYIKQELGKIYK